MTTQEAYSFVTLTYIRFRPRGRGFLEAYAMGYRRNRAESEEDKQFHAWLKEYRGIVEETGLPEFILQDNDHWYDFVDHGYLDHHQDPTGFSADDLSPRQKAALLNLLCTRPKLLNTILGMTVIGGVIAAVRQRYKD